MATKTDTTTLSLENRGTGSSRATRRLRREGKVPGVLYGREQGNLAFAVDARELRHALAASGAVLELDLDGKTTSAVVKDSQRHPVRGDITHLDLVRVDVNQAIEATVSITVVGSEDAPGIKAGGILEQPTREVTVEALPNDIPETIEYDASTVEIGDTVYLDALVAPAKVKLVLDETAGETPLVTVTAPRTQEDLDELETETEVVGEADADADAGDAADATQAEGDDSSE